MVVVVVAMVVTVAMAATAAIQVGPAVGNNGF